MTTASRFTMLRLRLRVIDGGDKTRHRRDHFARRYAYLLAKQKRANQA